MHSLWESRHVVIRRVKVPLAVTFILLFAVLPVARAETVPEITVVAPRQPTAEELAGDSVATFIRSHGKPSKRIGQLGRWEKAPCPATVGLSPAFNEYVTTRISAIENAAQIPQPREQPCKQQNVLIVFTPEPQAFLNDVAKNRTAWLGFHYLSDVSKLKTVQRPVQAWYATATRSKSVEIHQLQSGAAGAQPDVALDDAWSYPPAAQLGSRLTSGLQSWIVFALIVVDTGKVTGFPIGSISDYIAMMTLQQTQLIEGCGELPSILDLLAPSCAHAAPDAITAGDVAYLKALYRIDMAHDLSMQRSTIEDLMTRQFENRD
jgi:hypothetical protein